MKGHVRYQGKSWYYAIDLGRDVNGKRKIKKKEDLKQKMKLWKHC